MKRFALPLTVALLVTAGCRTVPERDVRFEPTPDPVVRAMLELAGVGPGDVVYDLGSGDGRIPIAAARDFGARGVGIEIDPALVSRARAGARAAGVADKVTFRRGNMHEANIRDATVVTLFLHPEPNIKLRPKLRAELRPGARVVSYMWDMGDWTPDEKRPAGRYEIFLWRIPERTAEAGGRQGAGRASPK
jgi:SAM-dependent methyltransferase